MQTFWSWLLSEARQPHVDPNVLQGYEAEFRRRLEALIRRTEDPMQRQKLIEMLDCPVTDTNGRCRDFSEYVLAALIKSGVHRRYDIEAALAYVMEKMLLDRSMRTGEPRANLFGGFNPDGDYRTENPLQARFLTFLSNAIKNIQSGRIPRLSDVQRRLPGTVSISPGRQRDDDLAGAVPADRIAARPSGQAELEVLLGDIRILLQRKEAAYDLPLVLFFDEMLLGQRMAEQRRKYGDKSARMARQVIIQTVEEYARSSGNYALLNMLQRFQDYNPSKPMEPKRQATKSVKAKLPPRERDYASIATLIKQLGRPVGTADLGRYRRRWLDYPPRDEDSPHCNRLDATLEAMISDGVLVKTPTERGGYVYSPGAEFERYAERSAA